MTRINFIVEGPTEETFVNDILSDYMSVRGVYPKARSIETSRRGSNIFRGGMTNYQKAKRDILQWLSQDSEAYVTTMFDFYALPGDFPGVVEAGSLNNAYDKVNLIQSKLTDDIGSARFIPYIQLHEFEALLFSDIEKIDSCMSLYNENGKTSQLQAIVSQFDSPEHINNSPQTAPSKRLKNVYWSYDKVFLGSMITGEIGLEQIKNSCSHFSDWLDSLINLADPF